MQVVLDSLWRREKKIARQEQKRLEWSEMPTNSGSNLCHTIRRVSKRLHVHMHTYMKHETELRSPTSELDATGRDSIVHRHFKSRLA